MTAILLAKAPGKILIPFDPAAEAFIDALKLGEGLAVEARKARNVRFHRKFFALLRLAYDVWEPAGALEWRGVPIEKDFDRFRDDILILAGHYAATYRIDGEVRLTAKSVSFSSCDEGEFQKVYSGVLNVVWKRVLRNAGYLSAAAVEAVVDRLMEFGE